MNITANGRTIEQVLGGGFFRVPRFQRPYSWDRANVEDFWLDVVARTKRLATRAYEEVWTF